MKDRCVSVINRSTHTGKGEGGGANSDRDRTIQKTAKGIGERKGQGELKDG